MAATHILHLSGRYVRCNIQFDLMAQHIISNGAGVAFSAAALPDGKFLSIVPVAKNERILTKIIVRI